jgi:hypothetical protein
MGIERANPPAKSGKKANSIEKLTNASGIGSLAPAGVLLTGIGEEEGVG